MPDKEKKTYASDTLGLPPLSMVLVQAENDRQNATARTILESPQAIEKRKKQKVITKLIQRLNEEA